jgi:putative FmdB family regulatory protein
MPLYEYQCDACDHRFEVIQKFSDAPIAVCPKCGGTVKKLLSSPAIQFKGSGWYITDYARSGKADSGKVAAGKNESGSSASSDSAPAKTEAATPAATAATPSKAD